MTAADPDEARRYWQSLAGLPGTEAHLLGLIHDRINTVKDEIQNSCPAEKIDERRAVRNALQSLHDTIHSKIRTSNTHSIHAS